MKYLQGIREVFFFNIIQDLVLNLHRKNIPFTNCQISF